MLCSHCGSQLAPNSRFCPSCGSSTAPITAPGTSKRQSSTTANVALVACSILILWAVATLHGFAATLAVLCIIVGGFTVFSKQFATRKKLYSAGIAIVAILVINGIEGMLESKEQQRQAEAARHEAALNAAEEKRKEEAFKALSPAEHLEQAKSLLKVNAPITSVSEAFKHLAVIPPNTPEAAQGAALRKQYVDANRRRAEVAARAQAVEAKKQQQLTAGVRKQFAEELEQNMLAQGDDVSIAAVGPNSETLRIRWVLIDRPFVYKFINQSTVQVQMIKAAGFKKLILTDGYDKSWSYDVDKL